MNCCSQYRVARNELCRFRECAADWSISRFRETNLAPKRPKIRDIRDIIAVQTKCFRIKPIVPTRHHDKLKKTLWPDDAIRPVNVWAVLDTAKDPKIFGLVSQCYLEKCCLFAGEIDPVLERSAPHLIQLSPRDSVSDSLLALGWGQAWGIFLQSDDSLRTLRRHLRTILRVKDDTGRHLLFRYYDPRVLRVYLPTCLTGELKTVFGSSIIRFRVESEDPGTVISFELDSDGQLKQEMTAA